MTDEQRERDLDDPASPPAPRRRTSVWQLIGVGVAALVTATVGVLALTAGEPQAEASPGNGSSGGANSGFGYPFCRANVADTGDGIHVAVTLENDLPRVWAVVSVGASEQTVEVPLERGMGQAALPVDELPDKVVIWGTPDQRKFSSGCYWAPT